MMHIAGETLALYRFSGQQGLGYGLRDCYELAPVIRQMGIDDLLHPELKESWNKGFAEDREAELKDESKS